MPLSQLKLGKEITAAKEIWTYTLNSFLLLHVPVLFPFLAATSSGLMENPLESIALVLLGAASPLPVSSRSWAPIAYRKTKRS